MRFDVMTLFPELVSGIVNTSITGRAIESGCFELFTHNIRDFSDNPHRHVDDTPYGGGAGMLIQCQPVIDTLKSIDGYHNAYKIITSAQGNTFNQVKAKKLSELKHIIIICGHYEGIDNRILNYVDEEISIGDFIMTGGEIPALTIIDSVIRLLPNAITDMSIEDESFENGLLEYPQYTKPYEYDGHKVPEVLMSGNHEEIRKYRLFESLKNTYLKRPELLKDYTFDKESLFYLDNIKKGIMDFDKIEK